MFGIGLLPNLGGTQKGDSAKTDVLAGNRLDGVSKEAAPAGTLPTATRAHQVEATNLYIEYCGICCI